MPINMEAPMASTSILSFSAQGERAPASSTSKSMSVSRIRPGIFQGDDHDHDYDDHDHDHGDDYDDFVCENLGWKHSTGQHKNEEQQLKHCPNFSGRTGTKI